MKEKFYITTAIDYVNASPHIGHALEKVQADVIARYNKLKGKEIYFLSGTDEHGAKVARSAEAANIDIREFVDENAKKFKNLLKIINISNDDFIRTSDQKRHWPAAKALWAKLVDSGDIYKSFYKGLYCVGHEAFVTEKDLVNGKCQDHGKKPEIIEEENYFFRLSKYTEDIKSKIENNKLKIIPEARKNEILSLLNSGLEDISFSRPSKDISWGIPVPGDASQTMYVWCDALTNYISALGYGNKDDFKFKKFWPADVHIIGKDILRFHSAIWPGMLLSAGLPLPRTIFAHGFITVGGQKMSKTLGNVIAPFELVEEFGVDAVRYYLIREIPTFEDGDFTKDKLKETYNADLANGIGNLAQRILKMAEQYFNGKISKPNDLSLTDVPFRQHLAVLDKNHKPEKDLEYFSVPYVIDNFIWPDYEYLMEEYELNKACGVIWELISNLDKYIDDYKPFKLIQNDKKKTKSVLWCLVYGLTNIGWMLAPFLPDTSKKILNSVGAGETKKSCGNFETTFLLHPLFPRKD
jgi:methionyl-tRNA synthetase